MLETFQGYVECPLFAEECSIRLEEKQIAFVGRIRQLAIMYGEISSLYIANYKLMLVTESGVIAISRMGQALQWLYEKLYDAYNGVVLGALKVTGTVLLQLAGEYQAEEDGKVHDGPAVILLYEDCLCILPPNENARRLPLCFVKEAGISAYTYILELYSGERVTLSKLGRELDVLDLRLTQQLQKLGEKTSSWHKELAPGISSMQAAYAVELMPYGRAAQFQKLSETAPRLAAALEAKLKESRIGGTYPWLLELCGGANFWAGLAPAPQKPAGMEGLESLGLLSGGAPDLSKLSEALKAPGANAEHSPVAGALSADTLTEQAPEHVAWILVPDQTMQIAAVELSLADNEAAATYLYRIPGNWETFAILIDRALEAATFDRQFIRLSEAELQEPEHLEKRMLVKRTPALKLLRQQFAGRAIHSSLERWKKDIEKCCIL